MSQLGMHVPPDSVARLQAAVPFTAEDFAENRSGLLSAGQIVRLQQQYRSSTLFLWGGLLAIMVLSLMGRSADLLDPANAVPIILLGVLVLTSAIAWQIGYRRHRRDLDGGRVEQAYGPIRRVQVRARIGSRRRFYQVQINGRTLHTNDKVFVALQDGVSYTIHYTSGTQQIVSIMPEA